MEAFLDAVRDANQGGFFTGFSKNRTGTKPGFAAENETFLVRFEGIQTEKLNPTQERFFKDRFESSYDWEQIMQMILECLEYYDEDGDYEIDCQSSIMAWLGEFGGWGLMFVLLPMDFQQFLFLLIANMNVQNRLENLVKTNLQLFEDLQDLYEIERETVGLPLSDLVPKVEARLLNIIGGPRVCERRKMLKVKFLSQRYTLIANFTVEKKRLRRNLVEHAAEVVARMVDDTEELEIPETLKPIVSDKIIDSEWVASHWCSVSLHKYKLENPDIKLDGEKEDHDKTAHAVTPVPRFPMTKWISQKLVPAIFFFVPRIPDILFTFGIYGLGFGIYGLGLGVGIFSKILRFFRRR